MPAGLDNHGVHGSVAGAHIRMVPVLHQSWLAREDD